MLPESPMIVWWNSMFCSEYSPTYYGLFFEDPSGNRVEDSLNFAVDSSDPRITKVEPAGDSARRV